MSGKRAVDNHKKGEDAGGAVYQTTLLTAIISAEKAAPYAADKRLDQLITDCRAINEFYKPATTWGKNVDLHHRYVRQLKSFLEAGAPMDHAQLYEVRFWIPEWQREVLEPFIDSPIVGDSKMMGKFKSCFQDYIALNARLKTMEAEGWKATGRGKTKSQHRAEKEVVPDYAVVDKETTEADFKTVRKDAEKLLKDPEAWPGDIQSMILRLKSIRPKVDPQWLADDVIPPLIKRLEKKFARTEDPEGLQKSADGVTIELDLDETISVGKIQSVLSMIANEAGEIGKLTFKLTVRGEFGNWAISGFVEGWANLEIFYGVSDTMTSFMGFDVSAAIGAGISLAGGLAEGGIEAGAGYNKKVRFGKPGPAALWLYLQLKRVNDVVLKESKNHVQLFKLSGSREKLPMPNPTVVTEKRSFVGAHAKVDAGVAGISASTQKSKRSATFEKDGTTVRGTSAERKTTYTGFVKVGGVLVTLAYTKTHSEIYKDINTANEGDYMNHAFSLDLDLTKVIKRGGVKVEEALGRKKVFKLLVEGIGKFESLLTGGVPTKLIDKLVTGVSEKLFDTIKHARKYKIGANVAIDIEWNSVKEHGSYRNQYIRAGVTPTFKASVEFDAKVVDIKAELEASKREVVYESIGSETSSYVFQRYIFAWEKDQWKEFVAGNKDEIKKLIKNMGRYRGSNAYEASFAKKLRASGYPKGTFAEHLKVLEAHFESKRSGVIRKNGA